MMFLVVMALVTQVTLTAILPVHNPVERLLIANDTVIDDRGHNLQGLSMPKFLKKKKPSKNIVPTVNSPFDPHYFVAPIRIGTTKDAPDAGRAFKMVFDTTSSDIFVMGEAVTEQYPYRPMYIPGECTRYQPRGPTYYASSGTAVTLNKKESRMKAMPVAVKAGSGYEMAYKATNSVKIGSMILGDVRFGVVEYIYPDMLCLRGSDYDGVVGLNFRELGAGRDKMNSESNGGYGTSSSGLFHAMMNQKKGAVQEEVVSLYMSPDGGKMGRVIFGGVEKQLHWGNITYFSIAAGAENHEWKLNFDGIKIGSTTLVHKKFVAQFESTYKYGIYSPHGKDLSTAIMKKAPGSQRMESGGVVIDCDERESLPILVLMIGNHEFRFNGEEYFPFRSGGAKANQPGQLCRLFVEDNDGENPEGVFALGVPFMKKYYTALDIAAGKIGLALAKPMKKSDKSNKSRFGSMWKKKLPAVSLPKWMKKKVAPGTVPKWVKRNVKKPAMPKWMKWKGGAGDNRKEDDEQVTTA